MEPGGKVCERTDCARRAVSQLGRPIRLDDNSSQNIPYVADVGVLNYTGCWRACRQPASWVCSHMRCSASFSSVSTSVGAQR
ncbi:short-chain fatty acyl-CoA regulator family protein [Nocardia sp. NPDC056100]|uniref:short-chain fatty acyl-CoA regulator family protein n=1 Tax=Nocardia sp. NPDC056100 TaxID=3345712 RepID=UPI0035E12C16